MPLTDHAACPSPLAEDDELIAWLCQERNRRYPSGQPHQFLASVHQWLHSHGSITSAQRGAVGRIMRGEPRPVPGATPDIDIDGATPEVEDYIRQGLEDRAARLDNLFGETRERVHMPPPAEPAASEARAGAYYNRAATWEEASNVPAGIFGVRLVDDDDDDDEYTNDERVYKIHVIRQARNNSDLVGKRVISMRQDDGSWSTFGFVTRRGRLKVWRRFESQASHEWIRAADGLLHLLSESNDVAGRYVFQGAAPTDDGSDEWWYIRETERHCRVCGEIMELGATGFRTSMHSLCANRGFNPRREVSRPRRVVADNPIPRRSVAPPATPAPARPVYSELGTGWLQ